MYFLTNYACTSPLLLMHYNTITTTNTPLHLYTNTITTIQTARGESGSSRQGHPIQTGGRPFLQVCSVYSVCSILCSFCNSEFSDGTNLPPFTDRHIIIVSPYYLSHRHHNHYSTQTRDAAQDSVEHWQAAGRRPHARGRG